MKVTHLLLLFALLFPACKTPTAASKPKIEKAGSGFQFEEVKLPSANPCAVCVSFSATTRYVRGNINWGICSNQQAKGYLDLKLSKTGRTIKLRLMRDCSTPNLVKVLRCPGENDGIFIVNTNNIQEGNSQVAILESGVAGAILTVTVPSSNQIGIELKSGWRLDIDRQACTSN